VAGVQEDVACRVNHDPTLLERSNDHINKRLYDEVARDVEGGDINIEMRFLWVVA
jgi:hypothetical protein